MVAPAAMMAAKFIIPKLIDVGIPAFLAGRKGQVEKGMQARLKNLYAAQAGGRSGESGTAQSQRALQQQQQLKQAMNQVTGAAARGAAGGSGASGVQAAAALAAGGQAQQMLNMSQSASRDEALKKGMLARKAAAGMEGQLLGTERDRNAAVAKAVTTGLAGTQKGEGAAAGTGARGTAGSELFDVAAALKKQMAG